MKRPVATLLCSATMAMTGWLAGCSPTVTISKEQSAELAIEAPLIHVPDAVRVASNGPFSSGSWTAEDGNRWVVVAAELTPTKDRTEALEAILSGRFRAASLSVENYEKALPPTFSQAGLTVWSGDGKQSLLSEYRERRLVSFTLLTTQKRHVLFLFEVPKDQRAFELEIGPLRSIPGKEAAKVDSPVPPSVAAPPAAGNRAASTGTPLAGTATAPPPAPTAVSPGEPSARGNLDKEIIRRVVRRRLSDFVDCYSAVRTTSPALKGRLTFQFTIARDGLVSSARRQGAALGTPRFEECLVGAIRHWTFPEPLGGGSVSVTYPFSFEPR